ncbi:MAG: hypothetical protein RIR55_1809 [Bacteroidota bacterium]
MKSILKFSILLSLLFIYSKNYSQGKVVLEQIQVYSTLQPNANYWQLPKDISLIEQSLDSGIFKEFKLEGTREFKPTIKTLTKQSQVGKIVINWENTRSIPYHAYLELYELDPSTLDLKKEIQISQQKKDSIQSVWAISVSIFNLQHEQVFQKSILLGLMPVQNVGMGRIAEFLPTTPNNLFQAISKSVGFISSEIENFELIDAKIPEAFFTDNYWMPLIHNQPRVSFDTSKQFISFASKKGLQLLRIPPANLIKLDFKNKATNYQFKNVIIDIKNSRKNINSNEYYQVTQALRDVHENKDYSILAYLEFDPDHNIDERNNGTQALNFLDGIGNYIFSGIDTIGKFQIKEMVVENTKFYFPNTVYNGYDSSKQYNVQAFNKPMQIVHSKVISGNLYNHTFKILFDNDQTLKTILVDEKEVMIIDGFNKPRLMVTLPNNLEDSFRNLLILIAYGELFQSPN